MEEAELKINANKTNGRLLFGYAYPALECFNMLEQHPSNTRQLQFWCQYWIIVAIVTMIEMLGDFLLPLLPMYYIQAKLVFLVYLWHPKTMGTDIVYETFLRPLVMQYEPDIEERFRNLRAKSGQLLIFYLKNFTEKGQTLFIEVLRYVVSKATSSSERIKRASPLSRPVSIKSSPVSIKKEQDKKEEEKNGVEKLEHIADILLASEKKNRRSSLQK
ncbi:hypothetical protein Cni_G21508 [Canna indica]|uniref:HVA22-like protein n=1 Tax=Canna indica TaxID=4628 RepID=A0AAQ3QHC1_9LILI|nr:hypothetical protein Cni_G21508 [Canna indica]